MSTADPVSEDREARPEPVVEVSVVVPVFNEQPTLRPLYERVQAVLDPLGLGWELIYVDDSSTDGTFESLSRLHREDPRVRVVRFSRNFGHQIALTAGMDRAGGAAIVTMDGDLQHPPELLPDLIRHWRAGEEVVYTIRKQTRGIGVLKRATSWLFYRLLRILTGLDLLGMADFRLLDRRVLETLKGMRERARFLRGMVRWVGFRQVGVEYVAEPRTSGKSRYGFGRMFRFAIDAATSFTRLPLRIAAGLSLFTISLCVLYGLYILYVTAFTDRVVPGWASVILVVLFLGSLQLLTIGLLGEYIGQIHEEVKGRPLYIVRDSVGFSGTAPAGPVSARKDGEVRSGPGDVE